MLALEESLSSLPVGMIITDAKGVILYGSEKMSTFLHTTLDQMLNQTIQHVIPTSNIIKVIKTGEMSITPFENTQREKGLLLGFPYKLKGSETAGLILLLESSDIERIVDFSEDVANLKLEMEAIMNLSGELVTITDEHGRVQRVNAACERLMGVKESDFVGQTAYTHEENLVMDRSSTKRVLEEKRPVTIVQTTKSDRRLLVSGYPIYNESGKLIKVINFSKDITEQDNLSKQLEETKALVSHYQTELLRINQIKKKTIVVKSKVMNEIYDLAGRIADVESTVLILGESGVGKEVLARTIHDLSSRRNHTFQKINCGAIPESLMESELFGYSKGTFTGGNKEGKKGIIVNSHRGTLFLDEIGELPLHLQVKLLQVLQEKQVTPLGSTDAIDVDVRFIAATNRNLDEMVEKGLFREDLYYRLNIIPITIPSLRERKDDIPFFIDYFLHIYNSKYGKNVTLNREAMQLFMDYRWSGNVRELQNLIERLVVTIAEQIITPEHLPNKMKPATPFPYERKGQYLKEAVEEYEKELLLQTLKRCRTMKEAGIKLGVDISTISRKIKKYQIKFEEMQ